MDLKNTFITIDSPLCEKKFSCFTLFLLTVLRSRVLDPIYLFIYFIIMHLLSFVF